MHAVLTPGLSVNIGRDFVLLSVLAASSEKKPDKACDLFQTSSRIKSRGSSNPPLHQIMVFGNPHHVNDIIKSLLMKEPEIWCLLIFVTNFTKHCEVILSSTETILTNQAIFERWISYLEYVGIVFWKFSIDGDIPVWQNKLIIEESCNNV